MSMASYIHFYLLAILVTSLQHTSTFATKKAYIVYMGSVQHGPNPTEHDTKLIEQSHYELMETVLGSSEKARESVLYNYNNVINGFAARLTEEEAEKLKACPNVVSVSESRTMSLPVLPSRGSDLGLEQKH